MAKGFHIKRKKINIDFFGFFPMTLEGITKKHRKKNRGIVKNRMFIGLGISFLETLHKQ
jgi:hypothetical protein